MNNSFDIKASYNAMADHYPNHWPRPVIGITGNFGEKGCELAEGYYRSIELSGAIPVVIPPTDNRVMLASLLDRIDGIVLSGGADLNPLYLGEEPVTELGTINPKRDEGELTLVQLAYDKNVPMLGICRGIQVIAAALGGTLYQDLESCLPEDHALLKHSQKAPRYISTHSVTTEAGSMVQRVLGEKFFVNSFHHQAVKDAGPKLRVTAHAADGVIEAVESNEDKSIYGVQWHPECYTLADDKTMAPLFRYFIEEAESYRQAKAAHSDILTLDSHTDTPMMFANGASLDQRRPDTLVDLHRMSEGMLDAVVLAAYLPQGGRSIEELADATMHCDDIISSIKQMVKRCYGASLALTPKALFQTKMAGKKAFMIGIENGYAIGRDLTNLERYRKMGVIYMTLCHNGDNDICDSACKSNNEHGGLSDFGRQVVAEMNRVGIMVDLSHTSEKTFYDVLSLTNQPVICSHSSARALCDHPRNLTDDQLRALVENGGVAQATFYAGFLRSEGEATIKDAVAHIMHIIDVAGIDHVGIGSDFDGDGGVRGLASEADCLQLTRRLMAEGLNVKQLRKVWGGNFVRVMSQIQYNAEVKLTKLDFRREFGGDTEEVEE